LLLNVVKFWRTPLSKQSNKHLQTTLIEAAKMAPRNSLNLALVYDRENQKGNANRAILAVDRGQRNFVVMENEMHTAT
jgi:transposase